MKTKNIWLAILLSILNAAGCSTTLQSTALNEEGYFDTGTLIESEGIKTVKKFKPEFRQLLFVKTDEKDDDLNTFYIETFRNMNWFTEIKDKGEMESLVFEKELTDVVSSVSDRIGLHNLQKQVGTFLVVEPYVEWESGFNYTATLTAFDSESGEDVLVLEQKAINWSGLDKPLFYPLFNAFLEWARGEEISTKVESSNSR